MSDIHTVIEKLKVLEAKATPGEWIVESDGHYPQINHWFYPGHLMTVAAHVHGYLYAQEEFGISERENQEANAALIALSRNELPHLLSYIEKLGTELREAQEKIDELEGEIREIREQLDRACE